MSRAIVQNGFNEKDPESTLELVTKPIPKAESGQVVVNITLRPVHPVDLMLIRTGRYIPGATPGSEGFGIVHAVSTHFHKQFQPFSFLSLIFSSFLSFHEQMILHRQTDVAMLLAASRLVARYTKEWS